MRHMQQARCQRLQAPMLRLIHLSRLPGNTIRSLPSMQSLSSGPRHVQAQQVIAHDHPILHQGRGEEESCRC
jgi:hypothetical protein